MARMLKRRRGRGRAPTILQGYIFVSSVLLVALVLIYTHSLIQRMERQSDLVSKMLARFFASATFAATGDPAIVQLFDEVIVGINFPIIITDARGIPLAWRGIGIDPDAIPYETYQNADALNPPPGPLREVLRLAAEFDRRNEPIPMTNAAGTQVLGTFHFGDSEFVPELRWVPLIQLATVGVLVFLGYLGYRGAKVGEQRSIWVGMAKETAHQLGTPLSALLGWMEILKARCAAGGEAEGPPIEEILEEMERDVQRAAQVASRFETIGSLPRLTPDDVSRVAHETVEYFRRRWTQLGKGVEVAESYAPAPSVYLNAQLMHWVFENLFRNALDAMEGSTGRIEIRSAYDASKAAVEVRFSDSGRGMSPAVLRRAFEPGFTTKRRGWGLGLALVRRIVEEYHGGRIEAHSEGPGKGTTFILTFPV